VSPARTSVAAVVPRAARSNVRSSQLSAGGETGLASANVDKATSFGGT
jgi:hypothetical protein